MKLATSLLLAFALVACTSGSRDLLQDPAWVCPGAGQFPSAPCSGEFYNCGGKGEAGTLMACPGETVFNPETSQCDYSGSVSSCPDDPTTCPGAGNFKSANCGSEYLSCAAKGADPVVMDCPAGTYFDPLSEECDYHENVLGCTCTTVTALVESSADFSILSAALAATGLNVSTDDAYLNVTIFAPTNEAFMALFSALNITAEEALSPENLPLVQKVLLTHAVPGAYSAADLASGLVLPTLNSNETLMVEVATTGTVTIKPTGGEAATVIKADISACSAIVHEINAVLVPENAL